MTLERHQEEPDVWSPSSGDRLPSSRGFGHRQVPRRWRVLRGWRVMVRPRSRAPHPLGTWMAMSPDLSQKGHLLLGVIVVLFQVSTYLRPSAVLKVRTRVLMQPMFGEFYGTHNTFGHADLHDPVRFVLGTVLDANLDARVVRLSDKLCRMQASAPKGWEFSTRHRT